MNKDLDSFTVEEIEEIISTCQQEIHNTPTSDEFPVSPRVLLSLARIALAAKRAEPVGYLEQNHLDYLRSGSDADIWPEGGAGDIPVYLAPQLNSLEMPEGWTSSDPANAALVMLDRIDTIDSADDDRIEDIKLIIRQLAAAPESE
ncbi:hypothetical protein [Yersinia sp. 22-579]|uniref:hypothetical protein n=1 Tax=Yersinia sp. 22-579 TaxID=3057580 RepID=UPI00263A420E|nr:hypothetical protein [Yersinia sp. 22-579]